MTYLQLSTLETGHDADITKEKYVIKLSRVKKHGNTFPISANCTLGFFFFLKQNNSFEKHNQQQYLDMSNTYCLTRKMMHATLPVKV